DSLHHLSSSMRVCSNFHLVFIVLAAVEAGVSFHNSEVLQAVDFGTSNDISFSCEDGCTVFVDRKDDSLQIIQNDVTFIASFTDIFGSNPDSLEGFTLPPGKNYKLRNEDGKSKANFVFYAVRGNLTAEDYSVSVAAPQGTDSMLIPLYMPIRNRYATVLSSFSSIELSSFKGSYPHGFPKIHTAGFDTVDIDDCPPVFQGRSQSSVENSSLVIVAPILTIDFGSEGSHSVLVNNRQSVFSSKFSWPSRTATEKFQAVRIRYMCPTRRLCTCLRATFHVRMSMEHTTPS
ncbi:hypothetical protein PMAYCL1PPCAC_14621, partial [Pristionchus mayeri]